LFKNTSTGIYFKVSIPPAYIAWKAGTTTLFLLGSQPPFCSKIQAWGTEVSAGIWQGHYSATKKWNAHPVSYDLDKGFFF
jgi:hypothetical protein